MNSLCHIINLAVAMIAYVCCCHLNSTPDLHLHRASDHDRCKNLIAADESKALILNHWETHEQMSESEMLYWVCPFYLTAIIMSSNKQTQCFALINKQPGQMWLHFFNVHHFCCIWSVLLNELQGYMRRPWKMVDAWGCGALRKEELCRDGVRCVEIKQERREQAGSASDNSRKDNKGEGVSCECSLRKSLLHLLL